MCAPSSGLLVVNEIEEVSVALSIGAFDCFPLEINFKVFLKLN